MAGKLVGIALNRECLSMGEGNSEEEGKKKLKGVKGKIEERERMAVITAGGRGEWPSVTKRAAKFLLRG
jgi:hypothetical protein